MSSIEVRNPVAEPVVTLVTPATRLGDLRGKRIGLYWNIKAGGDNALQQISEILGEKYPGTTFNFYQGDVGMGTRHATPALVKKMVDEVDAVVGTSAD